MSLNQKKSPESMNERHLVDIFVREASKFPKLTFQEELKLARIIQKRGTKRALLEVELEELIGKVEIDEENPLNESSEFSEQDQQRIEQLQTEIAICEQDPRWQNAVNKFVEAKLLLVVSVAAKVINPLPLIERIQAGNEGLRRAVINFNPDHEFHFSTYAAQVIKSFIQRSYFSTGRKIRIPQKANEELSLYNNLRTNLSKKLGHQVTNEEIAQQILKNGANKRIPQKEIGELMKRIEEFDGYNHLNQDCSLDENAYEEGDISHLNLKSYEISPFEEHAANIIRGKQKELVQKVLGFLTPREQQVLDLTYFSRRELTQEEIGLTVGVSRTRVQQIIEESMDKIRKKIRRTNIMRKAPIQAQEYFSE